MMERQKYPDRFTTNGQAEPPYDVAGWTLPLLMGVQADALKEPLFVDASPVFDLKKPEARIIGDLQTAKAIVIGNQSNDDLTLIQILISKKVKVSVSDSATTLIGRKLKPGFAVVALDSTSREVVRSALAGLSCQIIATTEIPSFSGKKYNLVDQRIALYQPWEPSMNEGWTRLVLERLKIPFQTIHRDEILAGNLRDRYDCILFPSITSRSLKTGYKTNETAPEYVGGLEGAKEILKQFVEAGGTLVGIENSCNYLIQELGLPVEDAVASVPSKDFYGPGSILMGELRTENHPLSYGLPVRPSLYFDRSLALKSAAKPTSTKNTSFESVVSYSQDSTKVLQSGWLLGPEKIAGLSALGECRLGQGQVVLIAFPAQNRAQTYGTFRMIVNAAWRGGMQLDQAQ
jgi:hypothetical protein